MHLISMLGDTMYTIAGMGWKMLWALVLGFAVSGAVQAFVPKRHMARVMGDDGAGARWLLWGHQFVLLLCRRSHEP